MLREKHVRQKREHELIGEESYLSLLTYKYFLTMRKIQRKRATLELQSGLMEWKETFEQLQSIIAKFGGGEQQEENWQLNKRQ